MLEYTSRQSTRDTVLHPARQLLDTESNNRQTHSISPKESSPLEPNSESQSYTPQKSYPSDLPIKSGYTHALPQPFRQ